MPSFQTYNAHFASLALLFSAFVLPALSQDRFSWRFTDETLTESNQIPACASLSITTDPATPATSPLYMISYEIAGRPQTQLLERNDGSLSYTVRHAAGTRLMLNLVDSRGGSGGIPDELYEVVAGESTDCLSSPSSQNFTIRAHHASSNTSSPSNSELQTCAPWPISIKGGTPPYNVTLATLGAPGVTNVTLETPEFDLYTYINRAPPGAWLVAAVSDSAGRWAEGVPLVNTVGSDDVECNGAGSSGGVASPEQIAEHDKEVEDDFKPDEGKGGGEDKSSGVPGAAPTGGSNDGSNDEAGDSGRASRSAEYEVVLVVATLFAGVAVFL